MYWDSLTATGVFVSLISTLAAFYLVFRSRPDVPRDDLRKT